MWIFVHLYPNKRRGSRMGNTIELCICVNFLLCICIFLFAFVYYGPQAGAHVRWWGWGMGDTIDLCICVYLYLCLCIFVFVFVCICICVCVYLYLCLCVFAFVPIWSPSRCSCQMMGVGDGANWAMGHCRCALILIHLSYKSGLFFHGIFSLYTEGFVEKLQMRSHPPPFSRSYTPSLLGHLFILLEIYESWWYEKQSNSWMGNFLRVPI